MSFYTVLSEAIEDFLSQGCVSATQVAVWQARLKDAAEVGFRGDSSEALKRTLSGVFDRLVVRGGFSRSHKGLSSTVVGRALPALQVELAKHQMAARAYLALQREEAVLTALRRFAAWAITIPLGGLEPPLRYRRKEDIKVSLKRLPLAESHAIVVEAGNLSRSLNDLLASEGRAIAAQWCAHRAPGYAHRADHLERDRKVYIFRESWAWEAGFLRRPFGFVETSSERPGAKPGCRCSYTFFYSLEVLPKDFLSAEGRAEIARRARLVG